MLERFAAVLEGLPCPPDRTVLLAVSGGMDSMCMADLFYRTGRPFEVLHCDFALRGAESDADRNLVELWCRLRNIPFRAQRFDTAAHAAARGISIEMAARDLRYAWFDRESVSRGQAAVAVAHHADDNAETLLLNLLRGTGLEGIRGMRPVRRLPGGGALIRPMLSFSRAEIAAYAAREGVPFREDRSNADTAFLRNRIRHDILPVFATVNPSYLQTLTRDMRHFDEAAVAADAWYRSACGCWFRNGRMPLSVLQQEGGRYLVYRLLRDHGFPASVPEQIAGMVGAGRPCAGHVWQSASHRLALTSEALLLEPLSPAEPGPWVLTGPGEWTCGAVVVTVCLEARTPDSVLRCPPGESVFDADAVPFPLRVRGRRDGDWLRPIGLGGRKKISDVLTDLHADLFQKEKALVLADEGSHVLSLLGCRTDESVMVTDRTVTLLRIRIR